jgi:hypothetical protein
MRRHGIGAALGLDWGATPLSAAAFCSASSATPHSAASASWSTWSLNAMVLGRVICFDRVHSSPLIPA